MALPADIVNRALDLIGRPDLALGDLEEGTEAAKPALRAYGPALRQLLRSAHWDFARKQSPLTLLGDATGQTPGVGTLVQAPWTYCYELPIDCMKVRFLPWNTNPVQPTPPPTTASNQPPLNAVRLIPAPFLVALDYNYPVVVGAPTNWSDIPDWAGTAGEGPVQRTVINTNVPPQPQGTDPTIFPSLVYTCLVLYPSQWDSLFEEAMVQLLASRLAMSLAKDPKLGLAIRAQTIAGAKEMIGQARLTNANESAFPQTIAREASWIRARNAGAGNYWGGGGYGYNFGQYGGPGMLWGGWDSIGFSDGSVY